jgi:transcriptional regulator with XRE-family HTH domain
MMTKKNIPRNGQRNAAAGERSHNAPLERLRRQVDAASTEASPDGDRDSAVADWAEKVAQSGVLRRAPLSPDALEMVAELTPLASVTAECLARLERERLAVRDAIRATAALEAECHVSSPADLLRDLRERAGITADQTAALFGVTPTTWIAVERKQQPWYQLSGEALPAFADAVREPIERLVGLIAIAARRALYSGIEGRANLSLGRFDDAQGQAEARRDTLRVAFARVQDENRGAARFLEGARQAAGLQSKGSERKKRQPGPEKR